jgi:hypothetical protein
MIRITDQYFWNFVFGSTFLILVFLGTIILATEARIRPEELVTLDMVLLTLATFRLTRLFVYDAATKFIREQFWNARKTRGGVLLEKPKTGPRRTLADLFDCPWCFGVWAAAFITFWYLVSETAFYFVLLLAIAGVATFIQLTANAIGWQAEKLKRDAGG